MNRTAQEARYLAAARTHGAMIERLARGYEADPELRRDLVQEIHAALDGGADRLVAEALSARFGGTRANRR